MEKLPWYQLSVEETCSKLGTDCEKGLSQAEAQKRLAEYGPNELAQKEGPSIFQMFMEQFKDVMIIILIIASVVSMAVGEVVDSLVIIGIVILNACLGVFQEYRASKAMEALKKMSAPNAKVVRDGKVQTVPAIDLVPGDLAILETGDFVPADMRIVESINLKVEEAALTGESVPVEKDVDVKLEGDIGLGDQVNSGFMSTLVTYGRGSGIVTTTGMNTVMGKIAEMIQEDEEGDTPLQRKLAQLGKILGAVCLAVSAMVFVMGMIRGEELIEMFMTAVSLAVAAIPEGLPAVVTIVLALGMQRMVKHNSIMKKLHAVETLGSTTVICSDKTGTLTQNQMTTVKMYVPGTEIAVTGEGYQPQGEFTIDGQQMNLDAEPAVKRLLEIQALCNDSRLDKDEDGAWKIMGDPTEGAMIVAAAKAGMDRTEMNAKQPRLQELPFDSKRKLMTTFHKNEAGQLVAYTKGAPDILISQCTKIMRRDGSIDAITPADIEAVMEQNKVLANQALRVLAMSFRLVDEIPAHPTPEKDEQDMVFTGLVGMIDLPRVEAIEAIRVCKKAGIRVIMITGDYKDTAAAIARDLGLIEEGDKVLAGPDLNNMDDAQLEEAVKSVSVFARVSPEHKVRIVQAVKNNGEIAAMTGDGVNDAPALKRADIGIAMGITGTDVTKETADMVITDDNFASIVAAVEEGRVIYSNIRKFVFFLMSCNVGEILIIFIAMLAGWPIPLLPIHLLWVNLVTDSLPALALGTEKGEPNLMDEPPRDPNEPIMNKSMMVSIAVQSTFQTIAVLGSFMFAMYHYAGLENTLEIARTYAFVTLIGAELLRVYAARSEKLNLWHIGFFTNRNLNIAVIIAFALMLGVMMIEPVRVVFSLAKFNLYDFEFVLLFSAMPLIFGELLKVLRRAFK